MFDAFGIFLDVAVPRSLARSIRKLDSLNRPFEPVNSTIYGEVIINYGKDKGTSCVSKRQINDVEPAAGLTRLTPYDDGIVHVSASRRRGSREEENNDDEDHPRHGCRGDGHALQRCVQPWPRERGQSETYPSSQ